MAIFDYMYSGDVILAGSARIRCDFNEIGSFYSHQNLRQRLSGPCCLASSETALSFDMFDHWGKEGQATCLFHVQNGVTWG